MKRKNSDNTGLDLKLGKTRAQTSFGPSNKTARGDPFWGFLQQNGLSLCALRKGEFGTGILIENLEFFERSIAEQVRPSGIGLDGFMGMFQDAILKSPETLEVLLCPLSCTRVTTVNPSIIRVFLGIEALQPRVLDCLLEQLILASTTVAESDDGLSEGSVLGNGGSNSSNSEVTQYQRIIHLIVSHLQWLNVSDAEGFTSKLLDVVASVPSKTHKSELILALPTIVEERYHSMVSDVLLQNMADFPSTVLESLAHLTLPKETEEEIARRALNELSSANPRDLPALVSFILNSVSPEDSVHAKGVAGMVRERVSLEQICAQKNKYSFDRKGFLDVLLFSLRTNKLVASSFFESLTESFKLKKDMRELDVFIVLGLFSMEAWRKKIVKLLESGAAMISESGILRSAIVKYAATVRSLFSDTLSLAELVLRTAVKPAKPVGKDVYSGLLEAYPETHETRRVLSFIVTHLSPASSDVEISLALSVLEEGALKFPRRLERFPTIFREIVERLDRLSYENVKRFYYVYACLAFVESGDGGNSSSSTGAGPLVVNDCVFPDVSLVLQKQASNVDETYKKIGACGAVSIIRRTGPRPGNAENALAAFKLIKKYSSPRSLAFFYDELTKLIQDPEVSLSREFVGELSRELPDELIKNFMVSKKAGSGSDDDDDEEDNNSSLWYNNLGKADGYSVVIYPIVKSNKRDALLTLCPLFKLVSSCEKASGVSALLNSPVVMFSRAYLGPQSDRKESEAIAFSLFHAIRWMRELLNVFHSDCCGNSEKKESSSSSSSSSDEDSPSSNKAETIVKRLDNLCELIERYTNVSKEWASPKLPGPPLPLPVPVTIPKRLFFRKSVVGNDNDNMSFRDLEFSTVLDLLQLLGDQEDDSELHKVSTKFRFLLTELAPRFSGDDTLIGTSSRDELAYAASVLGKLLPRYIWMIRDVAEHNRGNNDEMIVYDDLKVSAMYAINFVNRLISVALGASDIKMIRSLIGGAEDEDEVDSQGDDLGGSNSTVESSLQVLFKKYQKACAVCTKIELFAGLINVLETISARVPEFRPNVSKLCEKFLTETGEDEEMTPEGNYNEDYIKFILEHYVQFSPNPAVSLKKLLVDNLYPFVTSGKDPAILLLKKPLVPMFYCTAVKLLNFVHSVNDKNIASTNEEKVRAENNAIELFSAFLGLTKDESFPISNKILLEILRSSNTFLLSLQKKMKMFSDCFTSHRPIIVSSFKSLQIGTRQLHSLCEYCKEKGSVSFIKLIPQVKKSMESIIFSVKMLLSTHGLLDSKTFNIGLLKPKDIHGNVVDAGPRVTSKRGVPSPRDGGSDSSGYSTSSDAASRKRAPRGGLQRRLKAIKLEPRYSPDDNEDNENRETDEENDGSDNGDEDEDNSSNNSDGDVDDEE